MLSQHGSQPLGALPNMNYRQLRCQRGMSRTDRPVPGDYACHTLALAPGLRRGSEEEQVELIWRVCLASGFAYRLARRRLGILMQADHVRIIQGGQHRRVGADTSANRASAIRSRLRYLIAAKVPGASCRASTASPEPPEPGGSGSVCLGTVYSATFCLLAAVPGRVTRPVTSVSSRIGCACFRAAGPGRGWGAAGGAWRAAAGPAAR